MSRAVAGSRRHGGLLVVGLFALSGVSLVGICAWAYADRFFASDALAQAQQAMNFGDADRAAKLLEPFVAARPDHVAARALLGRAYLKLNRPQDAAAQLAEAVTHAPKDALLWALLGDAHRTTGSSGRALAAYVRATNLASSDAQVWRKRGLLELETGDGSSATLSLSRSYELDGTQRDLPELIARAAQLTCEPSRAATAPTPRPAGTARREPGVPLPTPPDPLSEIEKSRRK